MQYLKETDVYQHLVESIKSVSTHSIPNKLMTINFTRLMCENILQLDQCDPKPAKPLEYIADKIGFKMIGVDGFMTLKKDLDDLRNEVQSLRKELTKLKISFTDDIEHMQNNNNNNNTSIKNSTMNGHKHDQSLGLVFGDICFDEFTTGIESDNILGKVKYCSLTKRNVNVVPEINSDSDTSGPEMQNDFFTITCDSDGSANGTISNETSDSQILEMIPEELETDEIASATVSSIDIISAKSEQSDAETSFVDYYPHSTEISTDLNITGQSLQSITDIASDQSKTSATYRSHSTEANFLACNSDGSANETFTDESLDIQILEMILEENETDENTSATVWSTVDTIPTESISQTSSAIYFSTSTEITTDLNSAEQSSHNITDMSSDQSQMNDSDICDGMEQDEFAETQENSMEMENADNISETTRFIRNCDEMQAARLPPSDSEDSEVKMTDAIQPDEMVTYDIRQQIPNDTVRELTGLDLSDNNNALIMESVENPTETDAQSNCDETNAEPLHQGSSQSSASSSSSDVKTVVEYDAQVENGIADRDGKGSNGVERKKACQLLHDDMETEFLLTVSSVAKHSIRMSSTK